MGSSRSNQNENRRESRVTVAIKRQTERERLGELRAKKAQDKNFMRTKKKKSKIDIRSSARLVSLKASLENDDLVAERGFLISPKTILHLNSCKEMFKDASRLISRCQSLDTVILKSFVSNYIERFIVANDFLSFLFISRFAFIGIGVIMRS